MQSVDWSTIYDDDGVTAENLTLARNCNKPYYRNCCPTHGNVPYRTLDNTCPMCVRDRAKARRKSDNSMFHNIRELVNGCIKRAKKAGMQIDITTNFIRGIVPRRCPVLGTDMVTHGNKSTSPSIDRLDSSKGYTEDNVRVISSRANRLKNDGSAREHLLIAVWMMREMGLSENDIKREIEIATNVDNSSDYQHIAPIQMDYEAKTKLFIERAISIHGDKYDYSKVKYQNTRTKVTIICPIHGEWNVLPTNHTTNRSGCAQCKVLEK